MNIIIEHRDLITGIEVVTHAHDELDIDKLKKISSIKETWISNITTSASLLDPTLPFAHTVSCGFLKDDLQDALNWFSHLDFTESEKLYTN